MPTLPPTAAALGAPEAGVVAEEVADHADDEEDPEAEEPVGRVLRNLIDHEVHICEAPFVCLLYTSPSPRDVEESRMPSSA